MTIVEALTAIKNQPNPLDPTYKHLWARPVGWVGSRRALTLKGDTLTIVPDSRGGRPFELGYTDIVEDWEVRPSKEVLKEVPPWLEN